MLWSSLFSPWPPWPPSRLRARADTYGAEANPTGEPIGGGTGYSRILTPGEADTVVATKAELLGALASATSGTIIYVDDAAVIDLTGESNIAIPGGVTLASGRGRNGSEGRSGLHHFGATRLPLPRRRFRGFTSRASASKAPTPARSDSISAPTGIATYSPFTEIDNCEFFGWSTSAISFSTGATTGSYAHHNYIHHNQRDGLGYGVVLNAEHIFIVGNLFDFCRHAIAATGRLGSGYDARWNVHLEHTISHMFDMHGERDYDKYILVGLWHLDEGSGTWTNDYSIYNGDHDGTLVNMTDANWVAGEIDRGVWFDGADDYIDLGADAQLSPAPRMTLGAWVKPENVSGTQTIFGKGDSGETGSGYTLRIRDGLLEAVIYDATGARQVGSGGTVAAGAWNHVALTHNGSTVRLYVAGAQVASFPCSSIAPSSYRLLLGRDAPAATHLFRGTIDEMRIYSDDLDAAAIARHAAGDADLAGNVLRIDHNTFRATNYNALTLRGRPLVGCWVHHNRLYAVEGANTFQQTNATGNFFVTDNQYYEGPSPFEWPGSGALGEWLFEEGSGTTAGDTSGNGNDGTLSGMSGTSSWVPGTSGTALVFTRATGRVNVPLSATMGTTDNIAFSFLLRFDALGVSEEVFDNGFFRFFHRGEWAGDRLYFLARIAENDRSGDSAWNYWSGVRTGTDLEVGTWHHIVAFRSGNRMAIAIDGKIESDKEVFGPGFTPSAGALTTARIGDDFDGALDTFRMFRIDPEPEPVSTASLDWTGETNYESDGVHPETGVSTTTFRFRVRLSDPTGREPALGFPRLHILRDGAPYTNEAPVTMMASDLSDITTGRNYLYSIRLPKSTGYSYFFETETLDGVTTQTPTIAGPFVPSGGSAPLLSLANTTGYVIDGVEPDSGHVLTDFDFRIKVTDLDNDPPTTGTPLLYIEKGGTPIAGSPFSMDEYDAVAFYNGRTYSKVMMLAAGTDYRYWFEVADIEGMAAQATNVYSGPDVAPGTDIIAPNITDVTVSDIGKTSARISWQTDESATSAVDYGQTVAYGSRVDSVAYVTTHSLALTGLSSGKTYHFRAVSTDPSSNTATTGDYTFETQPQAIPARVPAWIIYY